MVRLAVLERALVEHPGAMVGGLTRNAAGSTVYAAASQNVVDFLYEYYAASPTSLRFFATNNAACRRDLLLALGGFDESFPRAAAEDRDFCERWHEAGRPLQFAAGAGVTHHLHSSLFSYVRQHLRYGQGATYLRQARQRRGHALPRVEPLGFYLQLVTFALRRGVSARALGLTALATLSQAAYVAGYLTERLRVRLRLAPSEPAKPAKPVEAVPEPSRAVAP